MTSARSVRPKAASHHVGQPTASNGTLAAYYGLLLAATLLGLVYGYVFSEVFFSSDKPQWVETALNILKLLWLIPLPYAVMNFYSFARYPAVVRPIPPPARALAGVRLYVRIVTRGKNPTLVAESAAHACRVLGAALPTDAWRVEVVTDNPLTIDSDCTDVIVVPADYQTPKGTKYKGRALNYALDASQAGDQDWIIHLDEETRFDDDTVRAIQNFVRQQHLRMSSGRQQVPGIGQGVILYGRRRVTNWITTLADSIRVGDDYGRFRLQFEHGRAYFGLHGSFIVISNRLEKLIGFDHGPESSITEDAYFALMAQVGGARFHFIHTFMDEQSPFTILDFIKQRRRWFGGLWLCVLAPGLPLKDRLILGSFMLLWSVSWLCLSMVYLNFVYPTETPVWLAMCGGVSFLYYVTLYIIGFLRTYDRRKWGLKYYGILLAQILLIPLFSMMEAGGVLYGIASPPRDFYVVKKEG